MSRREQQAEIETHLADSRQLADDTTLSPEAREKIRRSLEEVETKRERQKLEIVAFGTVSSGKSSVLNALAGRDVFRTEVRGGTTVTRNEIPWPGNDRVMLVDTPGLAEMQAPSARNWPSRRLATPTWCCSSPTARSRISRCGCLEILAAMEKPIVVCLNKEDWYRPGDRDCCSEQIAEQVRRLVPRENVVALRAQPTARVRTRVLADGTQMRRDRRSASRTSARWPTGCGRSSSTTGAICCWPTCCCNRAAWWPRPRPRCKPSSTRGPGKSSIARCGRPAPRRRSARCR